MTKEKITQKEARRLFDYDPITGIFKNRIKRAYNAKKGDVTGSLNIDGYLTTCIKGTIYYLHRLAFMWMDGYFPEGDIDHKDQIKHHNWWLNLRESSRQCNMRNMGNTRANTSGIKGVYLFTRVNKWVARIMVNGKSIHLGYYKEFKDAVLARLKAEQKIGWKGCESNSPAYKYVQEMLNQQEV